MAAVGRRAEPTHPLSSIIAEMTRPVSDILGGSKLEPLDDSIPTTNKLPAISLRSAPRPPAFRSVRSSPRNTHHPVSPVIVKRGKTTNTDTSNKDHHKVFDMIQPFCRPIDDLLPGGKVPEELGPPVGPKKKNKSNPKPSKEFEYGEVDEEADEIRPVIRSAHSAVPNKKNSRVATTSAREDRTMRSKRDADVKESLKASRKRRRAEELSDSSEEEEPSLPKKPRKRAQVPPKQPNDRERILKARKSAKQASSKDSLTIPRKPSKSVASTGLRSSITPSPASDSSLDHEHDRRSARERKVASRKRKKIETESPRPEKRKKSENDIPRRPTIRLTSKPIPDSLPTPEREGPNRSSVRSEHNKPPRERERERDTMQGHSDSEGSREREREDNAERRPRHAGRDSEKHGREKGRDRDLDRERRRYRHDRDERKRDNSIELTREGHGDRARREKESESSRGDERSVRRNRSKNHGESNESTRVLDDESYRPSKGRDRVREGNDCDNGKELHGSLRASASRLSSDDGSTPVYSPANEATSGAKRYRFKSVPAPNDTESVQDLTGSLAPTRPAMVELDTLLVRRKRMSTDFFAAKNQLKDLLEKKKYDAFEESARTAFRLGFEIALSKESELRLSEKQLRAATVNERIDRKRDIIDHYKYLTKKLAPHCIADLEKIGRRNATSYFRRGVQKVYLRQFALQRLWEGEQRKRESGVKVALEEALMSRREGKGGMSACDQFSPQQLQAIKEVSDGYSNIVSVFETAIRDLGDGCEEAGKECFIQ